MEYEFILHDGSRRYATVRELEEVERLKKYYGAKMAKSLDVTV